MHTWAFLYMSEGNARQQEGILDFQGIWLIIHMLVIVIWYTHKDTILLVLKLGNKQKSSHSTAIQEDRNITEPMDANKVWFLTGLLWACLRDRTSAVEWEWCWGGRFLVFGVNFQNLQKSWSIHEWERYWKSYWLSKNNVARLPSTVCHMNNNAV